MAVALPAVALSLVHVSAVYERIYHPPPIPPFPSYLSSYLSRPISPVPSLFPSFSPPHEEHGRNFGRWPTCLRVKLLS